eukprot:COSAG02_NODE_17595_length_992_cov_2.645017_2_plen_247_part_01
MATDRRLVDAGGSDGGTTAEPLHEPEVELETADDPALDRSAFSILERRDQLSLVLGVLPEGDALCAALVCRRFRDAVFVCWPQLPSGHTRNGDDQGEPRRVRFRTSLLRDMAAISANRFRWATSPWPEVCDKPWSCRWMSMAPRPEVVRRLAEFGALETLKALHEEHGASIGWDASACTAAADYGHLELLQWLRSEGCHQVATSALCCRNCVDIDYYARDSPVPLVTANNLIMTAFDQRLSSHRHGQ